MINYSKKAIEKAKKIQDKNTYFVTIGTSLICPCKPLLHIWYKISDKHPEFKIKIVPFEENHTNTLSTLNSNGTNLDFLVSACDYKSWIENFDFLKLGDYKFCIAVPIHHKLANKEKIEITDLSNESVTAITRGDSEQNQNILDKIRKTCTNVEIFEAPLFYDMNVYNKCEENGSLLVTLNCWKNIHPAFKTIPLDTDELMPYGIIYSKTPSEDALKFLVIIKEVINE